MVSSVSGSIRHIMDLGLVQEEKKRKIAHIVNLAKEMHLKLVMIKYTFK